MTSENFVLTVKELAKRDFDNQENDGLKSFDANFSINTLELSKDYEKWYKEWQPTWREYGEEVRRLRDEFFKEEVNRAFDILDKTAKDNGFSYEFGCGCCGGGITIEKDGRAYEATGRMNDE
jgi:hypothetical protein